MNNNDNLKNIHKSINEIIVMLDSILSSLEDGNNYLFKSLLEAQDILKNAINLDNDQYKNNECNNQIYTSNISEDDEKRLLSQMILHPNTIGYLIQAGVTIDTFNSDKHKVIFGCIIELSTKSIDITLLIECLNNKGLLESIGGVNYIVELTNFNYK